MDSTMPNHRANDSLAEREWADGEREWRNPENWRGGWLGLYVAPRDPRVWVRKRSPHLGWTLNYAHRGAWLWSMAFAAAALALTAVGLWLER
jgi:uncharacterized membrane protein